VLELLGLASGDPSVTIDENIMKGMLAKLEKFDTNIRPITEDGKVDENDAMGKFYTLVTRQNMSMFIQGDG